MQPLVDLVFVDKKDQKVDTVVDFLDKVCASKLKNVIDSALEEVYKKGNCYKNTLSMKREAISSRALWTGKKHYAMMVHNSEGVKYEPYKLKIMGLDIIKASIPGNIRKKLKEALVLIFEKTQSDLYNFVAKIRSDFDKVEPDTIARGSSVSDLEKWADRKTIYTKGTPIATRAALMYNHLTKSNPDITPIKSGDKIKFVYLKIPNSTRGNVIGFPAHEKFPSFLVDEKCIDRDSMFDAVFLAPLKSITDAIDWEVEKKANLAAFFG
jgi:hypothetical protein